MLNMNVEQRVNLKYFLDDHHSGVDLTKLKNKKCTSKTGSAFFLYDLRRSI
jgi:hypothetical protein